MVAVILLGPIGPVVAVPIIGGIVSKTHHKGVGVRRSCISARFGEDEASRGSAPGREGAPRRRPIVNGEDAESSPQRVWRSH